MDDEPVKKARKPDKRSQEKAVFPGFRKPDTAYFCLPNEWTDITAAIQSLVELKIIEYIARHTWGFNEVGGMKHITTDEFMYGRLRNDNTRMDRGTQLSDRGVKDGIELAEKHGYITVMTDASDKARIRKLYGLKMLADSDGKTLPTNSSVDGKKLPADGKKLPSRREDSSERSKTNTIDTHPKKDTSPSLSFENEQQETRREKPAGRVPYFLRHAVEEIANRAGQAELIEETIEQAYRWYQHHPRPRYVQKQDIGMRYNICYFIYLAPYLILFYGTQRPI